MMFALALTGCRHKVIDERPIKGGGDDDKFLSSAYQNPVIRNNCADPCVIDDRERTGYFYAYSTQNGTSDTDNVVYLPVYKSKDMVNWELVGNAFGGMERPQWVANTRIWAPDVEFDANNNRYLMYYSQGDWDSPQNSAVGVAVSNTPTGPFTWENIPELNPAANPHGMLVDFASQGVTNSIDPDVIHDAKTGTPYLFWGSFGSTAGVWAIELTDDGLAIAPGAEKVYICYEMEGTQVHYNNKTGYYYVMGSKGTCCEGANSSYHIVVARSQNITGPFEGKDGKLMTTKSNSFDNANNTIMQSTPDGYFAGTGHQAQILTDDAGQDWMCFHAYWKGNNYNGRCMLMDQVVWADGWPKFKSEYPMVPKVAGPKWLKPDATKSVVNDVIDNDTADALLETGDVCSCRNTSEWSGVEPDIEL